MNLTTAPLPVTLIRSHSGGLPIAFAMVFGSRSLACLKFPACKVLLNSLFESSRKLFGRLLSVF